MREPPPVVRPRVLVLNTSADVMEALADLLEDWGYEVQLAEVRALRLGKVTIDELLGEPPPEVVLFDLAAPMAKNLVVLKKLEAHDRARKIPFVITTTNAAAARPLLKERESVELMLKPFDLDLLHRLVDVASGRVSDEALWNAWFQGKRHP